VRLCGCSRMDAIVIAAADERRAVLSQLLASHASRIVRRCPFNGGSKSVPRRVRNMPHAWYPERLRIAASTCLPRKDVPDVRD